LATFEYLMTQADRLNVPHENDKDEQKEFAVA